MAPDRSIPLFKFVSRRGHNIVPTHVVPAPKTFVLRVAWEECQEHRIRVITQTRSSAGPLLKPLKPTTVRTSERPCEVAH